MNRNTRAIQSLVFFIFLAETLSAAPQAVAGAVAASKTGETSYEYGDFIGLAYDKWKTLVKVDPVLLNKHIPVDEYLSKVLPIYKTASADMPALQQGITLCSLFQLGYNDFSPEVLDRFEKRLLADADNGSANYVGLQLLAILGGRINKELLAKNAGILADALERAKATKGIDDFTVKKRLYRYLYVLSFFHLRGDRELIRNSVDRLYPGLKVDVKSGTSIELSLDLIIAHLLQSMKLPLTREASDFMEGPIITEERPYPMAVPPAAAALALDVDLEKVRAAVAASWRKNSGLDLTDCRSQCDLKAIAFAIRLDIWYGCIPEEHLREMMSYLLDSFRKDTAVMARDDGRMFFSITECDEFCNVLYWQKLYYLNYLLGRLNKGG